MLSEKEKQLDAEFKAAFPCPEFHDAASIRYLGMEADQNGKFWAFLQYPRNWMHIPYSARATVKDRSIELALRMKESDEFPAINPGDLRIIDTWYFKEKVGFWPELLPGGPPSDGISWIAGVELPFRPDEITIVDE